MNKLLISGYGPLLQQLVIQNADHNVYHLKVSSFSNTNKCHFHLTLY